MRKSKVLQKIRNGKVARICCMSSYLPYFTRHAAHFGFDGIWVDGEHRTWDHRETQSILAFHHLANIDCIWRPATLEKTALYRLLEDGAAGLMIPHVSTPEKAKMLVNAVKFPPLGDRGIDSAGLDADFLATWKMYNTDEVNRETFLMVQIETPEGLDNVEAIAAIPGVDMIFFGPGDYGLRMGCSAAPREPKIMAAQKKIAAVVKKYGKAWGRPVSKMEDIVLMQELGAQLIVLGNEFNALYSHLKNTGAEFDQALGEQNVCKEEEISEMVP